MTRRARTGQLLSGSIKADDWSDMLQMLQEWRGKQQGFGVDPSSYQQSQTLAWVKNESGVDIGVWCPIGLRGFTSASAGDVQFTTMPRILGGLPIATGRDVVSGSAQLWRYGITQEPIKDGAWGRVCVAGLTPAYVVKTNTNHDFADIENSNTEELVGDYLGSAEILTRTNNNRQILFVRLGMPKPPVEMVGHSGDTGTLTLSTSYQDLLSDGSGSEIGYIRDMEPCDSDVLGWKLRKDIDSYVFVTATAQFTTTGTNAIGLAISSGIDGSGSYSQLYIATSGTANTGNNLSVCGVVRLNSGVGSSFRLQARNATSASGTAKLISYGAWPMPGSRTIT